MIHMWTVGLVLLASGALVLLRVREIRTSMAQGTQGEDCTFHGMVLSRTSDPFATLLGRPACRVEALSDREGKLQLEVRSLPLFRQIDSGSVGTFRCRAGILMDFCPDKTEPECHAKEKSICRNESS